MTITSRRRDVVDFTAGVIRRIEAIIARYLSTNGYTAGGPPGSLTDGDKGDITVSGSGATWNIDAGAVSTTELGGDITTAGKALLDDANAAAQRTTLGIGTAGGVTLVIENLTSDPGSPTTGQLWLRTDL